MINTTNADDRTFGGNVPPDCQGPDVTPEMATWLEQREISPEVAGYRDYRVVESKTQLKDLGFADNQRLVPTAAGNLYRPGFPVQVGYFHCPNSPRAKNGVTVAVEVPSGNGMYLDANPFTHAALRDPSVPLVIMDSVPKADAAVSAGICAITIAVEPGTNAYCAPSKLAGWNEIAMADESGNRRLVLIPEDDSSKHSPLRRKVNARLKEDIRRCGGNAVIVQLPAGTSVTEALRTSDVEELHRRGVDQEAERPEPPEDEGHSRVGPVLYRETPQGIVYNSYGSAGDGVPLTNFKARIKAVTVEDDGAEKQSHLTIEVDRAGRIAQFEVPVASFGGMTWVIENCGPAAILYPGNGIKDHARTAIQILSGEPAVDHVYTHTGMREIKPGVWVFLHSGGSIGVERPLRVRLTGPIEPFVLPNVPTGAHLAAAVQAQLRLWDLRGIGIPLAAATYRAPLGGADFSFHVSGPTGVFKSEVAALFQQHFGKGLDARHLPASWTATDNYIEGLAFSLKDCLMVVDDYAPTGPQTDQQKLHLKADRIFRGQGNQSSRGRMRQDGSLKPVKPSRALIVSTGEDIPPGASLGARLLNIEIGKGQIPPDVLSVHQAEAAAGLYAEATAAFISWMLTQWEAIRSHFPRRVTELRMILSASALHRRTPDITAQLIAAVEVYLDFAVHVAAITQGDADALWTRSWRELTNLAATQANKQASNDPVARYLELLGAALSSGAAHLLATNGQPPTDAEAWGWRPVAEGRFEARGQQIGYVENESVYLIPTAALYCAKQIGRDSGEPLTLTERTLSKRLAEYGVLLSGDLGRETHTIRITVTGARRQVLHLSAASLLRGRTDQPAQLAGENVRISHVPPQRQTVAGYPVAGYPVAGYPVGDLVESAGSPQAEGHDAPNGQDGQVGQVLPTNDGPRADTISATGDEAPNTDDAETDPEELMYIDPDELMDEEV